MNRIDPLVKLAQKEPPPSLPRNFEEGVWRRIRQSGMAQEKDSLWDQLLSMMFQPRLALAVCIVGIGVGTFWSLSAGIAMEVTGERSLGLDVFSGNAPDLPSTLIAQRR